jgi:hypothetical protein
MFCDGKRAVVSRYRLIVALVDIIPRYYEGLPIPRKCMTNDGVVDRRYWRLAYAVLRQLKQVGGQMLASKTHGDAQLDLESIGRRWPSHWAVACGCCPKVRQLGHR